MVKIAHLALKSPVTPCHVCSVTLSLSLNLALGVGVGVGQPCRQCSEASGCEPPDDLLYIYCTSAVHLLYICCTCHVTYGLIFSPPASLSPALKLLIYLAGLWLTDEWTSLLPRPTPRPHLVIILIMRLLN